MKKHWLMIVLALVMLGINVGCVGLEEHQALQRANRTLEQALSDAKQDLLDAQHMNAQKDSQIDGLNKQLAAKDQTIQVLTDKAQKFEKALADAQAIIEKQAGKGVGNLTIVNQKLPDPLHKELKALAEAYPDVIEYDAAKGAVRWKADLLFPSGKDQLVAQSESMEALKQFAGIVCSDKATGFDVIVVGHTDNVPVEKPETLAEHKDNWYLSAHRAIAVMKLLGQCDVAMTRMGVMGYGAHRPIAENSTDAGKAKNRRVEIFLVSKDSVQTVGQNIFKTSDQGLVFIKPSELANNAG